MTRVALMWHMHQPLYQDLATGEHILPWVRLHGLKDYWGMAAILREFPDVRVTFNLVPSLLVQLEAFAREEARDRHLELGLKRADALTGDERAFCVENFFHAHAPRMIAPYPRYAELLARRDAAGAGLSARSQAAQFSTDDLRDLQVWHKLAWVDQEYLDRDPRVRALVAKGTSFSEEDKGVLRDVELELLRKVVPEYREASERGQVELSTSPFYHPILPLLCDTDVYLRTHPDSRMPREPFRHPGDASEQLARASAFHERLFGKRPDGVWPSEGSVSDAVVPIVARAGFQWMATDEAILAKTTGRQITRDGHGNVEQPELLYRAYRVGAPGESVACGFRDHTLSDLIGFTYAGWSAEFAADDFVQRLVEAGRRYSRRADGGEATVFVILDGENAWEYYEAQGRPFLRALYRRLGTHPEIRTVTMSEACAGAQESLPSIFPGSWINGDFYIWIGHRDDRRAWSQLVDARRAIDSAPAGIPEDARAWAREEMLTAEGSDWFWWYGDDHSSNHDREFDELFRRHVRNIYRALGLPVPEELFVTNISTQPPEVAIQRPTGLVHPTIDGEVTSYFEWVGAGCVEAGSAAGAMHQVSDRAPGLSLIEFGFDLANLYLRIDGTQPMSSIFESGMAVAVRFLTPPGVRVNLRLGPGPGPGPGTGQGSDPRGAWLERRGEDGSWRAERCPDLITSTNTITELQIPFTALGVRTPESVAFVVVLTKDATEVEHHPRQQPIEFEVPDERFVAKNWTA